ncbi:S-adenosyl-L-methionine-dependent methyltransferase [Microdochium bolleyi]|uniref:S-adenosyl-L-methionine-dependent methyltransferase n=1 Tax=Microdochium bolleyi TaxID=196109 RepID=A0A136IWV7_9PEZI|nr:S-adenosyl-L-methionine-dependent methyltransferase [Microdochium bolleyi]
MAHDHSITHQNKEYFDKEAATYDTRHGELIQKLTNAIRDNVDVIGADWKKANATDEQVSAQPVRLLDYACGTGMVSRTLGEYVDQCVGIDLSPQMVEVYNKRAQEDDHSPDQWHAVQGDLTADPSTPASTDLSSAEFHSFDIAAVGGGFHHFADPQLAAARLVERLRPGGVLAIWDFLTHPGHDTHGHASAHTIAKHGFSEQELRDMFTSAGAGEGFAIVDLGEFDFANHGKSFKRQCVIARGRKPGAAGAAEGASL